MKTLFFSILLFTLSISVKATELPLLNLEIGKTYRIETTTHIDTSEHWLRRYWDHRKWDFTPESFNSETQTYKMKAVLNFYQHVIQQKFDFRGWMEEEVYETGYLASYRSPTVYLSEYQIPVYFKLDKQGNSFDFDFNSFAQYKTPSGFSLVDYIEYQPMIANHIRHIFMPDGNLMVYMSKDCYKNRSKYEHINEDDLFLTVKCIPSSISNLFYKYLDCNIIVDKGTGLVLREHYNYLHPQKDYTGVSVNEGIYNHGVYYQKYIPTYDANLKVKIYFSRFESIDSLISTSNFKLKGKLTKRVDGFDSVSITLMNSEVYLMVPLNKNNEFKLEYRIDNIEQLQIRYPPIRLENSLPNKEDWKRMKRSTCDVIVETGDDLDLNFESKDTLFIKDKSVDTKNYYTNIISNYLNENHNIPPSSRSKLLQENKNKILEKIRQERAYVSPQRYMDDLINLTYINEVKYHSTDENITEEVLINNTLAKNTRLYQKSLERYISTSISAKISMGTGVDDYDRISNIENDYYLGQIALAEPVKAYFLAYFLKKTIREKNWTLSERLFQSYKERYYDKVVFSEVKEVYDDYHKIAPGQPAPDFELFDLEGRKTAKRDFSNQVVLMFLYNSIFEDLDPKYSKEDKEIKRIIDIHNEIEARFPKKLRYIVVYGGSKEKATKFKKQLSEKIEIFTADSYPNTGIFSDYKVNGSSEKHFILDRNGNISFSNPNWYVGQLPLPEVEKALAIPYKSNNQFPVWIRITLIILIGALISIVLTFVFYRNITKRRIQKSELNKKMRELELTAIRAQMNPHFMYNCLNSIQNLVQKNQNEEAHLYLSKFASLIRRTLNTSKKEEVSLNEELETINEYIELEKLRFNFEFELELEEGLDAFSIFVPPMLLQPFVENALLHGLLPKTANRKLTIKIDKNEDNICIVVEDNGVGRQASLLEGSKGNGKGLQLSKERLQLLSKKYQTDFQLDIEDLKNLEGLALGTRVSLCFNDEV